MTIGYESLTKESIESYLAKQGLLIEMTKEVRSAFESSKDDDLLVLINTTQFYAVNVFDMLIAIKSIVTTDRYVEKNLYARLLGVICYQVIMDGRGITGGSFRKSLIDISSNNQEAIEGHDKARKLLVDFEKNNSRFFYDIRNNSIAHRGGNLGEQLEFIEDLDVEKVFRLSADLFVILDRYCGFLAKFIQIFKENIQTRIAQ